MNCYAVCVIADGTRGYVTLVIAPDSEQARRLGIAALENLIDDARMVTSFPTLIDLDQIARIARYFEL